MAHVEDALKALARAYRSEEPVTITAEHARIIYSLITADPQVLAAELADVAIDATFAARDCFWSHTAEEDAYWNEHRRLCKVLRKLINVGWIAPEYRGPIDDQ